MDSSTRLTPAARAGLLVLLAGYGLYYLTHRSHFGPVDYVDLAIHETGHLVFGPFGDFLAALGGTLFQLIVPAVFFVHFARRGDRFAAAVILWWIGQSLWNVSVYVQDARAQQLPLVGGGEHDWAYLLGRLDLLPHDQGIGTAIFLLGVVMWLCAMWGGLMNVTDRPG